MGWFEDQLRYREKKNNDNFEESLLEVADAVMGQRLSNGYDNNEIADFAIDEILKYYHIRPKEVDIPSGISSMEEQIEFRLRPHGIMHRDVKLDSGFCKCAVGPMLGFLKETGDLVALIPHALYGYVLIDPITKKRQHIHNKKGEKLLDNEAICFYEALPLRKLSMADLFIFMCKQLSVSDVIVYFGLMLISTLLGMLMPVFTKNLFGIVLDYRSVTMLNGLAVYMISYSICRVIFNAYDTLKKSRLRTKQDIAVQAAVMNRMLSLPPSFFKQYSSGELSSYSDYLKSLCNTLFSTVFDMGFGAAFSLAYIGQIFAFTPALVAPAVIMTLASVVFGLVVTFSEMKISRETMIVESKASGMTYSMISGVQKIKLSGSEKRMFSRWARLYSRAAGLEYNPPTFLKMSTTISSAISLIGTFVLYYFAIKSEVTVSDYYAFNTAYGMVSGAFQSLASIAVTFSGIKPILEMSKPIMDAEPEISENKEYVTSLKGNIEVNNLSFRYSTDMPYVLEDISLNINAGEYIAIVGATGCGKSTLLRLLLGFEKPERGSIFYDKKNIQNLDLRSVRQNIGTVMQDGKLFFGDIFSNISIAAPNITLSEAWAAAEKASIADDIRNMPMGMNTNISEGQGGISGGQRQRIMIARALASNPGILMFDEATSALDNVTQKKISEAIDSLNCTRIVIAHRLSTIKNCDRIIVIDGGHIVEDGTYEELIARDGYFASLVERQRISCGGFV